MSPNKNPDLDKIKQYNSPLRDYHYCSFCGAFWTKMRNHTLAHKLRTRGEFNLAWQYY